MNERVFEGVQNFRYLDTLINSNNLISDEINSRIVAGNRGFYSLRQIFMSRAVSQLFKAEVYKTMVKPAAVFGSETGLWLRLIRKG